MGGGYYKPSNSLEVKEFVRNLESTADSMNKIADLAKAYYTGGVDNARSEERRVGKECRSRWSPYH